MVDRNLFLYDLAIVAIFKDEGKYLREWLDYHLLAGVEHFYLYNNDSSDDYKEILAPYVEANLVTLTDFPGKAMQYPAYEDAINKYRFESRYLAFIDLDEFIFPKNNTGGVLLKSLTKFYRRIPMRRVWLLIGNASARTGKIRQIILAGFWRDLRIVLRLIGLSNLRKILCASVIFTSRQSPIRDLSAMFSIRILYCTSMRNLLSTRMANESLIGETILSSPTKSL